MNKCQVTNSQISRVRPVLQKECMTMKEKQEHVGNDSNADFKGSHVCYANESGKSVFIYLHRMKILENTFEETRAENFQSQKITSLFINFN